MAGVTEPPPLGAIHYATVESQEDYDEGARSSVDCVCGFSGSPTEVAAHLYDQHEQEGSTDG